MTDKQAAVNFFVRHTDLPFDKCFDVQLWHHYGELCASLNGIDGPFYSLTGIRSVLDAD